MSLLLVVATCVVCWRLFLPGDFPTCLFWWKKSCICIFQVWVRVNISGHWHPQWMSMDDNLGQIIFGDLGGLKLPDICLNVRINPEKTSPRKLVPTGDRTRARCVTSAHATTCSTAVDRKKSWFESQYSLFPIFCWSDNSSLQKRRAKCWNSGLFVNRISNSLQN